MRWLAVVLLALGGCSLHSGWEDVATIEKRTIYTIDGQQIEVYAFKP